jgi:hypothetical protein
MTDAQTNTEETSAPSMEDILRSIRGVISGEDESNASAEESVSAEASQEPEAKNDAADEEEVDVLELDAPLELEADEPLELGEKKTEEATMEQADQPTDTSTEQPSDSPSVLDNIDNVLSDETGSNEKKPEAEDNTAEKADTVNQKALLEDSTTQAASSTIKELISSIPKDEVNSPVTRTGTTLEDLVIEAIKPMLAEWLNENLSIIVKQLVEKELKKIIPRDDE